MSIRRWLAALIVLAGCSSYPGQSYIEQDAATYEWAAPKLREWAEIKDDAEWILAVDAKLQSWEARYTKASEVGEATSE